MDPAAAANQAAGLGPGYLGGDPGAPLVVADSTAPGAPAAASTIPAPRQVALTTALPDDRARVAIATAKAQLGLPYVWGGDGPTNGDAGFDCSGLTTFSYRAAGSDPAAHRAHPVLRRARGPGRRPVAAR